jgi:transketolase N-terminal domain/subunit
MWPLVNGIALANRDKTIFCLGSDGSQQEGNDAEAARLAVAQNLNVKIIVDDNNVTIAGHPSEYLKGYELQKTLHGHGLEVVTVQGEDIDALWGAFAKVITHQGPAASKSQFPLLPTIVFADAYHKKKQSCPNASWLRGCLRSREACTVMM